MARLPDFIKFSKKHEIKIGTIADLIEYRSKKKSLIKKISEEKLDTEFGHDETYSLFRPTIKKYSFSFCKGEIKKDDEV